MTASPSGLISFVIPVYNEQESLEILVNEINTGCSKLVDRSIELIFIDDGSTDDSWNVIRRLSVGNPWVRGYRFRKNFGKAAALNAGFKQARGETIFTLDADLQDDPAEIPQFLELLQSYDLVSGYKQIRHDPWHKVFPSRVFNWMVSNLTGVHLHDHNCGYKAYRSEVTREIRLYGELHRYTPVLAASRGFRVGERVVQHRARKFGRSKFGFSRFLKGFLDLIHVKYTTTYSRRPLHFFGTLALTLAFMASGLLGLAILISIITSSAFVLVLILLGLSVVKGILAGASLLTGLLAETQAHVRTDEPFAISEMTQKVGP